MEREPGSTWPGASSGTHRPCVDPETHIIRPIFWPKMGELVRKARNQEKRKKAKEQSKGYLKRGLSKENVHRVSKAFFELLDGLCFVPVAEI